MSENAAMRRTRAVGLSAMVLALAIGLGSTPASAGPMDRRFGLGIILGEPTGLTAKLWLNDTSAVDFHLTWDFSDEAFAFFVDYLYHFFWIPESSAKVELPLYVGVGGKLGVHGDNDRWRDEDSDVLLGLRIPVGMSVLMTEVPLEFFVEVAPGLRLLPGTDADVDGGIGIRYYF